MLHCGPMLLLLVFLLQTGATPPSGEDGFSIAEKLQLKGKSKIDDRIKIYEAASNRHHKSIGQAVDRKDFGQIPARLRFWASALSDARADIIQNVERKKKSNALIKFEIQLRKSITDIRDARIKAPVEDQDHYDQWITHAEEVRKQLVAILFPN